MVRKASHQARKKCRGGRGLKGLPVFNRNAAGIDVGGEEHWVCVPADRTEEPVRSFGSFTTDLRCLVDWLKDCGVDTVVMESTSIYWIALFHVLEEAGLRVYVVNARTAKNLPGRKSDYSDCQWLQKLHTHGLLNNSFLPPDPIRTLRTYERQREGLIRSSGIHIQRIQKALVQMNVQLANVISDISGKTGMAIIEAIVEGERDPMALAGLKDRRIHASRQTIAKSLHGDWKDELLFVIRQELSLYKDLQEKILECDQAIEKHLQGLASKPEQAPRAKNKPRKRKKPGQNQPSFDVAYQLHRICGVDLTDLDGIEASTAQTIVAEVGMDMSPWKTEKHFASWLGLAPQNRSSGKRSRSGRTARTANRAATALRLAARSLQRSQSALGANYRRLRARLGPAKAITAMARKLACLVYRMLKYGQAYMDKGAEHYEAKWQQQRRRWLVKQAKQMGFQLVEIPETA